ncbi:hypothetical protein MZM54_04055 [[Brevibacterium] frigoritolerans]|nr:hypothetical protein [Peribacillus frigoritolerans]
MWKAMQNTYNSKLMMAWILIVPGIMAIISDESYLNYITRVLETFLLFVLLEIIFKGISKKNT